MELTWAHERLAANPEFASPPLSSSEPKVGDDDLRAIIFAQDILGFQVSMEDLRAMKILDGIQNLDKYVPNQIIISNISVGENHVQQVSLGAILGDEEEKLVVLVLEDLVKFDHTRGSLGTELVKAYFTRQSEKMVGEHVLVPDGLDSELLLGLTGEWVVGDSEINGAPATTSDELPYLQAAIVNDATNLAGYSRRGSGVIVGVGVAGHYSRVQNAEIGGSSSCDAVGEGEGREDDFPRLQERALLRLEFGG